MKREILLGACLAFAARPASAQLESALLAKVSFNLTSPGGKALAMGGAFTAIADDATAALANPAGLGLLSAIEGGVSGKRVDDEIGLVAARSTATGGLTAPYPDVRGVTTNLGGSASSFEFGGAVLPVSRRFVLAATYAENLRFAADPGRDGYPYLELRDNRSGGQTRRDYLFEYREFGRVALTNRVAGISAALRLTDRWRVGAGVTFSRVSFTLGGDAGGAHRIVHTTFTSPTAVETRTTTLAVEGLDGTAPGFVIGAHGDVLPDARLTVGASFRWSSRMRGTLVLGGDVPAALAGRERRSFGFAVPPDASAGVAWRPLAGLTVSGEAQWVDYSRTFDQPLPVASYRGLAGPPPGVPVQDLLADVEAPSAVVLPRLGVEYVARGAVEGLALAFRLGYHREPAHGVRANLVARDASGTPYDVTDAPFSPAIRTVFDGGRGDDRFSGGLGVTLPMRLSLDVAFDLGRSSRILAASLFYRF